MANSARSKAAAAHYYHESSGSLGSSISGRLNELAEQPYASLNDLATDIAKIIATSSSVAFSAVLIKHSDSDKQLSLIGYSAKSLVRLAKPLHIASANDWLASKDEDKLIHLSDLSAEGVAKLIDWSVNHVEHGAKSLNLHSVYVIKLKARGHLIGTLAVGFNRLVDKNDSVIKSLSSVKGIVATLISGLVSEQENYRNLKRVNEYSHKLSALDEAKDDFISMASHQLRTPLTSIKGYVSMILEGDAGPITEEQRTMLNQSFASCQRMVYIISDLLNVSRIRTGKFVIDRTPVNLDAIIRDEIDQLKEIAKSKSVSVDYLPPDFSPNLALDETKTRQVIMNFMDNAIYYTPANGRIKVSLINRESAVELRIKDNGMGVPRSEQHHLFMKFYRATNARKARPDGTGLGLFMAKKIVLAQGGAIIFESAENRGSTFGFIFPKTGQ